MKLALAEQKRKLFQFKGLWYAKPLKAAYGIQVDSWEEGMKLVFGSWDVFLDWYSSNLLQ